jgi:seryl-tRNA synthetase
MSHTIHFLEEKRKTAEKDEVPAINREIEEMQQAIRKATTPTGALKSLQNSRKSRIGSIKQTIDRTLGDIEKLDPPVPGLREHLDDHIYRVGDSFRYSPSFPPLSWNLG